MASVFDTKAKYMDKVNKHDITESGMGNRSKITEPPQPRTAKRIALPQQSNPTPAKKSTRKLQAQKSKNIIPVGLPAGVPREFYAHVENYTKLVIKEVFNLVPNVTRLNFNLFDRRGIIDYNLEDEISDNERGYPMPRARLSPPSLMIRLDMESTLHSPYRPTSTTVTVLYMFRVA